MKLETLAKLGLTLLAAEFFGPLIRDSDASHLLHPDWVGHARIHLVWFLGFIATSGLVVLHLIWRRAEDKLRDLWTAWAWEGCLMAGFWISVLTEPLYGGAVAEEETHLLIFGIEENILVFAVASVAWGGVGLALRALRRGTASA